MLNKLKSKKPPLSLSSVSNAIKNSNSLNLSPEIKAKTLKIATATQRGLPQDSVVTSAYDAVQSLLAVATKRNSVHVFGQQNVEVVFEFNSSGSITHLAFVRGIYLVVVELTGTISVLSIHRKLVLGTFLAPGVVTALVADPSQDFVIVGLNNGKLMFYDIDRLAVTPVRIDCLQKSVLPKQKLSAVLSIQWHPRDIGTLLVTYSHCAVEYSIVTETVRNYFAYTIRSDASGFEHSNNFESGGKKKLFGLTKEVTVSMVQALYHPNGLHLVTCHADGTLAFWDAATATLLEARTTKNTALHLPGPSAQCSEPAEIRARWLAAKDPEITTLVVSGASRANLNVMDVLDFGYTFKNLLTSFEKQGEYFRKPQDGHRTIRVPFNRRSQDSGASEFISQIIPLPTDAQPYFAGSHNPLVLMIITNYGGLHLLDYPLGSITNADLPPTLGAISLPSTVSIIQTVKKSEWYGVLPSRSGPPTGFLMGGAPVDKRYPIPLGNDALTSEIMVSGHEDGSVTLSDISCADSSNSDRALHASFKDALYDGQHSASYRVAAVSAALESRDLAVGLANGNVALARYAKPKISPASAKDGYEGCATLHRNGSAKIIDLSLRLAGKFKLAGFIPTSLLVLDEPDKISCIKLTAAGFMAVAYKSGRLVVCDVGRGPAVIMNLDKITQHLQSVTAECFVTSLEFSIMEYGVDGYSSLLLIAGTNAGGNLLFFKVVPQSNGGFDVQFADKLLNLNYKNRDLPAGDASAIDQIMTINESNGELCVASYDMFTRLALNIHVKGYVVVASKRDIRVLKTPKQKLSHKVIDESCTCTGVVCLEKGRAVLGVVTGGFVKILSLPALNDIADVKVPSEVAGRLRLLSSKPTSGSAIAPSGEITVQFSASESVTVILYDDSRTKANKEPVTDLLFNETAIIPPRPTGSALSWAKGQTAYINTADFVNLIAGPNRKRPTNIESELAYNISPEANPNQAYGYNSEGTKSSSKGYAEPVRRGGSQAANPYALGTGFMRTLRDGLDNVEEGFNNYANGMSESMTLTMEDLKRSFYSLALKSKMGF